MRPQSRILDHIDPPAKRNIIVNKAQQLREEARTLRQSNKDNNVALRGTKADIRPLAVTQKKLEKAIVRNKLRLERIKVLLAK